MTIATCRLRSHDVVAAIGAGGPAYARGRAARLELRRGLAVAKPRIQQ